MARNRHPEATVERILTEAARLFLQKGFEKTSMQDVMDATGLSKGAIYHHFASKEDILLRIGERMGEENAAALQRVLTHRPQRRAEAQGGLSHRPAKREAGADAAHDSLSGGQSALSDHPCARDLRIGRSGLYRPILEEGARDGSLRVEHPRQMPRPSWCSADMWINPLLRPAAPEEVRERCQTFIAITGRAGSGRARRRDGGSLCGLRPMARAGERGDALNRKPLRKSGSGC